VSSDARQSTAIISQRGNSGKLYGPGDMLPGNARLAEIEAERVILTRAGAREALAFETTFRAKQGAPVVQTSQRPSTLHNTNSLSTSSLAIQQLTAELAQSPSETLQRTGVSQESDGGYQIGNTANQPFLAQSGLLPGDVVLSVNGRKLGDVNVDRMALTNLASMGSVSLELLRNGQKLTITTRVPESLR
jgi:general secretion pathway protein C